MTEDLDSQISTPDPTHDFWYTVIDALRRPGGQLVNPDTAQRFAANYACMTAISESIAMLPATLHEQVDERTTETLSDHYLASLLRESPNPTIDAFEWFEMMQTHACETGDAFSHLQRSKSGKIRQITQLLPENVEVKVRESNRLGYIHNDPSTGAKREYSDYEMFHFKPHTRDGVHGRTPIRVCADAHGMALALQAHGANFFKNGAFLSGLLKPMFKFSSDDQRKEYVESFKSVLGAQNAGKLGLLENAEYIPFESKLEEAQYLELMNFAVVDIARVWRMPPMFIQVMDKGMSFSSSEQLAIVFVTYTIQPWVTRWEHAIRRQMLGATDKKAFVKFNISALLRGDLKSRTEAITQQMQYSLATINEGRRLLDKNPIDDPIGDVPLLSHNLVPVSQVGKESEPVADPKPEPTETDDPATETEDNGTERAFQKLFEHTFERLIGLEVKSVKRSIKKDDAFQQLEKGYQKHERVMLEALSPLVSSFFVARGGDLLAFDLDQWVTDYCDRRGRDVTRVSSRSDHDLEWLSEEIDQWREECGFLAYKLIAELKEHNE